MTRRVAGTAWVVMWALLAAWFGYPRSFWGSLTNALVASLLALFCALRLGSRAAPDTGWIEVYPGVAAPVVAVGAAGQLISGHPWIAAWSLGPPSIVLAAAVGCVVLRDWVSLRKARAIGIAAAYPRSLPPSEGPKDAP